MTTGASEASPGERTAAAAETTPGSELSAGPVTSGDGQETAPLSGTVAPPPNDIKHLEQEIERTREQLGATVQELVARVDVKSRALAKANELSGKYKSTMAAMPDQMRRAPEHMRRVATKGASGARERWIPLAAAAGVVIIGYLAIRYSHLTVKVWKVRSSGVTRVKAGSQGGQVKVVAYRD
jgi:Protein of unknown function (DUF3618)